MNSVMHYAILCFASILTGVALVVAFMLFAPSDNGSEYILGAGGIVRTEKGVVCQQKSDHVSCACSYAVLH